MGDSHTTLRVTHDLVLLDEPAFGSAPLALVRAGERVHPLAECRGFLLVERGQLRGYVPSLLCAHAPPPDTRPTYRALPRDADLWPAQVSVWDRAGPHTLPAREEVLVLGEYGGWRLVQRSSGMLGFLSVDAWPNPGAHQLGCIPTVLVAAAGWAWAGMNWLALHVLFMWGTPLLHIAPLIPHALFIAGAATMWIGPRRAPDRYIAAGALFQAELVAISAAPLI